MPPPTETLVVLAGRQGGEVGHIVCKLFTQDELSWLTRDHLKLALKDVTSLNTPLKVVANDLLEYLIRNERVGQFLDAAASERPRDDGLRQFIGRVRGDAQATPTEDQVYDVKKAIEAATAK